MYKLTFIHILITNYAHYIYKESSFSVHAITLDIYFLKVTTKDVS